MIRSCVHGYIMLMEIQYAEFKDDHPGGNHYNLEKWSKQQKAEYTFGTVENNRKMEKLMAGEDSD